MKNKAVLLVNLGSPDSPAVPDVRRFLREFLMDGRVLDAPWPIRFGIVNFAILPKRPHASAEAYRSIWTDQGSPLVVTTRRVQHLLQERLRIPVELAMRYQNPSIASVAEKFSLDGVEEVFLIPLFPHYAMSSYETAVQKVREELKAIAPGVRLHVQPPYYEEPDYIEALAATAEPYLKKPYDHLLFSYHGLPERHLHKSDRSGCHCLKTPNCCEIPSPVHATCYRAQCFKTTRAFAERTGLTTGKYSIAFQSRLGRDPWMKPYTDQELVRLAQSGIKRLLVICPAFVSDCLETLEEMGLRGRASFLEAGGTEFNLIPCLNEHPSWIEALENMVAHQWPTARKHSLQSAHMTTSD